MAVEKLLGIDGDIPERAVWMRMLLGELNRMASHLLFLATNGMDLGAVSMMIYGWREREEVLRFFQKVTGLRMNHNFIRPGGVAADLPAGWRDDVLRLLDLIAAPARGVRHADDRPADLARAAAGRRRDHAAGGDRPRRHRPDPALHRRGVGPAPRPCRTCTTTRSSSTSSSARYGDAFDRYAIRLNEIRESMRIVRQILDRMPAGDYRIQDKKVTPPPRARIDESMEALIHHFKIFTEGFKVPEGEVYVAVESPRGEIGCYIVRDGSAKPYRMHIRGPSFVNLQSPAAHDARRPDRRRRRRHLVGRPGPRARSTADGPARPTPTSRSPGRSSAATRVPKSALIPLLHLAQEQDGYVTNDAMVHIAELVGVTPAEVLRHGHVLRDVQVRAGRPYLRQHLHEHLVPARRRVTSCSSTPSSASASRPAAPPPTACSRSRTSSASRRAPRRRASR